MTPEIVSLFENIRAIYTKHGFNLFTPWQSWPTLNQYFCSPESLGEGWFIQTNESNYFEKFASPQGSHPVLGSHSSKGNEEINEQAFQELSEFFGLELVLDVDGENIMTYKGKRTRYYKITSEKEN